MFAGTAGYYAKYRPGYPASLFEEISRAYQLDGTGVLLDLGTGTGQLAIPLAPSFASVIAMDPDPEMLAEGERAASDAGVRNIAWRLGGSETLGELDVTLTVTTMGRSFHWMDRARVLRDLYDLTQPGGGVVIAGESSTWLSDDVDFAATTKAVVQKFVGERRRAGSGFYEEPLERHESVVRRSSFELERIYRERDTRRWTTDSIVGHAYSTSFASPAVLGSRLPEFERELRARLAALSASGEFAQEVVTEALFLRRSPIAARRTRRAP